MEKSILPLSNVFRTEIKIKLNFIQSISIEQIIIPNMMLNADIIEKPVTILQALDNHEVFVSIRWNRLFEIPTSDKSIFKLVFAITTVSREASAIINRIKFNIQTSEFLYEEHRDDNISHLIIYCKNADIAENIVSSAFKGYDLRSNTRYEKITEEELKQKAILLENRRTEV
ncbi:MAG: hypothetical protein SFU99_01455 [Saprospiraceae bacterium]|nr:hypothetical protein [Saprospiraceae bacterium]